LLILVSLIAISAGATGDKKAHPEKARDGTWIAVGMEQNGKKLAAEAVEKLDIKLTIKGENYTVTIAGKVADKGTSKIDTTKKPLATEITSELGPNKGKKILGIIEVDGDTLKACYDLEGKGRPTEFATKEGSGHMLIVYKRAAEKKGE
jgi:uncharacterized protein (TIGR03067 family)